MALPPVPVPPMVPPPCHPWPSPPPPAAAPLRVLLLLLLLRASNAASADGGRNCTGAGSGDWRNVCNGHVIYSDGKSEQYQDQPQVVVSGNNASHWSCVFTLNDHEGSGSQRVVSTVSEDRGQTWSTLVDIEPRVPNVPTAGWVSNLRLAGGREFAFYTYNADHVTTDPITGLDLPSANILGNWVYRVSEDSGASWSATRYNLTGPGGGAYRRTWIDRTNAWGGRVQEGWSVGKPSRRRDCHFTDTLCLSLLKRLVQVQGGAIK